ncbi:tetratricopeptide repeat protein (plasmid) [Phormidium sp. CLA17]|uniref:CHAT domain-containing protein n=1 Tax=Leptolyngbya sp. Cla-17 TaxID=2803751 RepID=UPI0014913BCF|nr:tetratricopeptide repeat protein [Leptolyngbya sp. Cla-17]MBM0745672.1 tetratricopeptide repeat protein [Leptolyngbya sp. Cla-17]
MPHTLKVLRTLTIALLLSPTVLLLSTPYTPILAQASSNQTRKDEAEQLNQQGMQQYRQAEYRKALESFQKAFAMYQEIGDRSGEGTTLNNIGLIYSRLGQYSKALEFYQQALVISKEIGDRSGEGTTLNNIGFIYSRLGQYSKALEFYQQALAILKAIGDRSGEGTMLNNIGFIYDRLGQYSKALEFYQQALAIRKEIGNRSGEGITLNNIGFIYDRLGQYSKALEFYQQALAILKALGDRSGEGTMLNNIGGIYNRLGQYSKALEFYQQALAIRKALGDRSGEGGSLNNIGFIYDRLGQYSKALEFYQQALAILKVIGDRSGEGTTLNNIGLIYFRLGQYSKALEFYQQALAILKVIGDHSGEGTTLNNIGGIYDRLGQYSKALEFYQQALAILKAIGDRSGEGTTLNNIGNLLDAQKQSELAIVFLKQSVSTFETIRQDLRVLPNEQQESYTKTVADTYRQLADLLLKQDRVLEAQQVLDLLKIQELNDYLRNVRGGRQPLYELPPEQAILKKYNELQKTAIQLGQELTALRKLPEASRTSAQQQHIAKLVKLQDDLNQQFNGFTERGDVVALVKQLTPTVLRQTVDLTQLDALRNDLRQLNAVLLYPLVLEDRLELVITTPDSPPLRRTVNVKREELNAAIVEFRRALQDPSRDAKVPAQKLYTWLIKPLEADLKQANAKTIIYAPDGQLRYIPLQALYDGQQWLVQRYGINNITARSFTEFKTQPNKQPYVLAGAFTTGQYRFQVGDRQVSFKGLPFAGKEVDALATLLPNTKKLVDKLFSRDATTTQMNEFNVVHLATHASFVPGTAANSFIVFGNGDKATLKDIESWSLDNVDLVVLSACETGLGGKFGNGEEILGLGYQFQNRGAKAAIASLWSVDDGGTQELMNAFYTALKQGNITKAEALQKAQLAMIQNGSSGTGKRGDSFKLPATDGSKPAISRNPSHPYYWAPFILIGNGL